MREKYLVGVSNKYEVLFMETDEQGEISSSSDKEWQRLKLSIQPANETAPKVERKAKQCWMSEEILEKRETRKKAKNTPAYVAHNKEIRKLCRNEKEKIYNTKCDEIEENLKLNATKKMHDNIKELTGKYKGQHKWMLLKAISRV